MTPPHQPVAAVVPAAGAARRFGSQKLIADVAGEPLLQHTLRSLLDGGVHRVILVIGSAGGFDTVPVVKDPRVTVAVNPDPERGMFSSIQAGLTEVPPDAAVLVLPADMPFVRASTVEALMDRYRSTGEAVVATYRGKRGHPLIIPAVVWSTLIALPAPTSLKAALADAGTLLREVSVDDPGVLRDVDVKEDLE